ncbi:hypothetical protein U8C32_08550 [Sinorhizobium medicae]|uniref:hypothetical protein n=1 Tax=Sinorhizobium medicae TaxID=110321 RepID=UPI001296B0E8|nr:hypothetical protein [Sinorhizobium medicae]MBO1962598.1 hypothetical protein [Sinorhizobium medicae]MQX49614.1 hypothetical protein [Sinorhizobium medicae]WQO63894.1 hypothetical protein U8C40_11895 [Sinorhizobium medicae]WQO93603.1 hypothetical protein U8C32_08550 [Sinorhizobium medicae]
MNDTALIGFVDLLKREKDERDQMFKHMSRQLKDTKERADMNAGLLMAEREKVVHLQGHLEALRQKHKDDLRALTEENASLTALLDQQLLSNKA